MTHHNRGDDLYTKYRTEYNLVIRSYARGDQVATASQRVRCAPYGLDCT